MTSWLALLAYWSVRQKLNRVSSVQSVKFGMRGIRVGREVWGRGCAPSAKKLKIMQYCAKFLHISTCIQSIGGVLPLQIRHWVQLRRSVPVFRFKQMSVLSVAVRPVLTYLLEMLLSGRPRTLRLL